MIGFLLKRLLGGLFVILGVVIVVFFLFMGMGDPARLTLGQRADVATLEAVQKELGLDKPKLHQLLYYINDLSPISVYEDTEENKVKYGYFKVSPWGGKALVLKSPYMRRSYQTQQRVGELLLDALPNTAVLALAAFVFAAIFGVFLGVISAMKYNTSTDNTILIIANLGVSVPSYYSSLSVQWYYDST